MHDSFDGLIYYPGTRL